MGLGALGTPRSAYAAPDLGRPVARCAIIGNSFEAQQNATSSTASWGDGWPVLAMLQSAGRMQIVANVSLGGTNMEHYLGTQLPSLPAGTFNTVIVGGAENDIQECVAAAMTIPASMALLRSRLDAIVAAIHARGAKPVLRTTAPHYYTLSHQLINAWNNYLKGYGALRGIPVADFYRPIVDPATGNYKSPYNNETLAAAIHPSAAGRALLAPEFLSALGTAIPARVPATETSSDAGQLSTNPAFLTLGSGVPTGWTNTAVTGVTRSVVTNAAVPGNMYRLAAVASAGISQINGPAGGATAIDSADCSAGDVLEWSQTIISDGGTVWTSQMAQFRSSGGTIYTGFAAIPGAGTFTFTRRFVVDPLMTLIQAQMFIPSGATGTVDFSHPSVRNLTREGAL